MDNEIISGRTERKGSKKRIEKLYKANIEKGGLAQRKCDLFPLEQGLWKMECLELMARNENVKKRVWLKTEVQKKIKEM